MRRFWLLVTCLGALQEIPGELLALRRSFEGRGDGGSAREKRRCHGVNVGRAGMDLEGHTCERAELIAELGDYALSPLALVARGLIFQRHVVGREEFVRVDEPMLCAEDEPVHAASSYVVSPLLEQIAGVKIRGPRRDLLLPIDTTDQRDDMTGTWVGRRSRCPPFDHIEEPWAPPAIAFESYDRDRWTRM